MSGIESAAVVTHPLSLSNRSSVRTLVSRDEQQRYALLPAPVLKPVATSVLQSQALLSQTSSFPPPAHRLSSSSFNLSPGRLLSSWPCRLLAQPPLKAKKAALAIVDGAACMRARPLACLFADDGYAFESECSLWRLGDVCVGSVLCPGSPLCVFVRM